MATQSSPDLLIFALLLFALPLPCHFGTPPDTSRGPLAEIPPLSTPNTTLPGGHASCLVSHTMVMLRHPDDHAPGGPPPTDDGARGAGRLNLLLSDAHWESESWADRLPPLLEPMGVRSIRVNTGREAEQAILDNRVHIALVDMALPLDSHEPQGGPRVLELLRRLELVPPTVVIKREQTHRNEVRELRAALKAGAFAVVDRPVNHAGFETMLDVLRRVLARFYAGRWPAEPGADPSNPRA